MRKLVWKQPIGMMLMALIMAIAAAPACSEIIARDGKGYVERIDGQLVLHLKGNPYELGRQHGVLLRDLVKSNLLNITDNQDEKGKSKEYLLYKMLRGGMHNKLKPHIPERFMEEMRGLADGAGLEFDDVLAGNLFPEAFHCSGIALMGKATHDGSLYHARLLDYMTDAGLQDHAVIMMVEPDGQNTFVNVSYAGFIGSITGMNEQQITIGEMGGGGQGHWDGMPMSLLIRDALERASDLTKALSIFHNTPRTCEYYYVISDAKIPDARGVYATPQQIHFVKPGENFGQFDVPLPPQGDSGGNRTLIKGFELIHSPVQTLIQSADGKVMGFLNTPPEDCVIISGDDRYKIFTERLLEKYGQVDEKVFQELITRPVSMKGNLHNAVFHPSTLEVWVANAGADGEPACNQPYYHYRLQKQDEPQQTTMAK
ncbi:MAG: peptidase C45 [Candidatus Omnitrophica bacterium]|nr:peptidase C45 [Candidatus Omnitrophota bacterium]